MNRGALSLAAIVAAAGLPMAAGGQDLGTARNFAALAGSTVTNTGGTSITGDVGVWPGTAITGFPPGVVDGTLHANDPVAQQAQADAAVAFVQLAGLAQTQNLSNVDLGGLTLEPGVYRFDSAATMSSTALTLDAVGDSDAVWVFQIATTLTTANNASVMTINGADGCNIYWQVGSSATLGTGTSLKGSILAQTSITLTTGASLWEGGAFALDGGVTFDTNMVSLAGCLAPTVAGSFPQASAQMDGRTTVSLVDASGTPIMLQRSPTGAWTKEALNHTASPVPTTTNVYATHTWVGQSNGKSYVSVATSDGLFVVDTAAEPLAVRNLTTEVLGAAPDATAITGASTVFINEADGATNIVGLNELGELVRYYQTGAVSNGEAVWAFMNISTSQLAPNGLATPAFESNLVSYVSDWGGLHVAGLNGAGEVNAVWWAPGAPHWWANNLSAETESPPFMVDAGLTAYTTPWGGLNLAGLDAQGNAIVQWWAPGLATGEWATTNLTETYGGPALDGAGLTSFVLPWGALNVAGVTPDGDLVNYWWVPGFDEWLITSIRDATDEPGAAEVLGGRVAGVGGPDGTISILAESEDGDMLRYFWTPEDGAAWNSENVSELATQP